MKGKSKVSLYFTLFFIVFSAHSKNIYTWVDANGVTHFSDIPIADKQAEVSGKIHGKTESSDSNSQSEMLSPEKMIEKRGDRYLCEGKPVTKAGSRVYGLNMYQSINEQKKSDLIASLATHENQIRRINLKLSRLNEALAAQEKAALYSNDWELKSAIESTKHDINFAKCELLANEQYFNEFKQESKKVGL